MKKLTLELENCYGIKQLKYIFDFEESKVYSIYAPNGFMKTSFSRTFNDLSMNQNSGDLIFQDRISKRLIHDENGDELISESIFVIEPYNQDFSSDKTSLLLVNPKIKQKYDHALLIIEDKKRELVKKLAKHSGLTGKTSTSEGELLKCFEKTSIFEILDEIKELVDKPLDERLSQITYCELFNEKTISFLESGEIKSQLEDYIEKYDDLVNKSPILSKTFNHYHARTIHKSLSDNGFFSAKHTVNLFDGIKKQEITTAEEFNERIEDEKRKILSNKELSQKFDSIDKKLTNVELRKFRDYLFLNKDIVAELSNHKKLQKDIWIAYLTKEFDLFTDLYKEYKNGEKVIKDAISIAKTEKTEWENVVNIFNKRFFVPFKIEVTNQVDVILKEATPQISFTFVDQEHSKEVDKSSLLKVLSQGEKRALYILNILFELNARKNQSIKTIIIADDIADSFDYKNKYAIVEYLKEISTLNNFYSIFLTHNFDFHRTISGRLDIPRKNRIIAVKNDGLLSLCEEKYQKNPFTFWKRNFQDNKFIISSIPFVRNLAEYCGQKAEFKKLTSLLHIRPDTHTISLNDLKQIFFSILKDNPNFPLPSPNKYVIDLIYEVSDMTLNEPDETAELESKIVLSIAIRLKAEEFMINKINDQSFVNSIKKDQTIKLLARYKGNFTTDTNSIHLLEKVNLMTPENIHLNSFMYEPILDMAPEHLKALYKEVKQLYV